MKFRKLFLTVLILLYPVSVFSYSGSSMGIGKVIVDIVSKDAEVNANKELSPLEKIKNYKKYIEFTINRSELINKDIMSQSEFNYPEGTLSNIEVANYFEKSLQANLKLSNDLINLYTSKDKISLKTLDNLFTGDSGRKKKREALQSLSDPTKELESYIEDERKLFLNNIKPLIKVITNKKDKIAIEIKARRYLTAEDKQDGTIIDFILDQELEFTRFNPSSKQKSRIFGVSPYEATVRPKYLLSLDKIIDSDSDSTIFNEFITFGVAKHLFPSVNNNYELEENFWSENVKKIGLRAGLGINTNADLVYAIGIDIDIWFIAYGFNSDEDFIGLNMNLGPFIDKIRNK